MLQIAILLALVRVSIAENIIRHSCGSEVEFYRIASDHALADQMSFTFESTTGLTGCIDACVGNSTCKAFNAKKITEKNAQCELLPNDRNTNAAGIVARAGWHYYDTGLYASKVGQWCSSQTYNPCYPCRCFDSCFSKVGYTCNCTSGKPTRPAIYMAFEESLPNDATKTAYNRGKNVDGKSIISLFNGAKIGPADGRPGNTLKLVGTNARANAGNFQGHHLNNPRSAKFTLSFWVKIGTVYSGSQVICGSGKVSGYSGVLVRVGNYAKTLFTRVVMSSFHLSNALDVKDTLKSWTHIAMVFYEDSRSIYLKTYVNGRKMKQTSTKSSHSATSEGYAKLNFGAGGVADLNNENWNMDIDDFAYWDYAMTDADIQFIQTQGNV